MAGRNPKRRIHFYRVVQQGVPSSQGVDLANCFAEVSRLYGRADWYLNDPAGDALCCWVDSARHIRFARVRRSALPQIERQGDLRPLQIPAEAGLAEQIHVVTFAKNIVGFDFNFYGPRLSALAQYLADKTSCKELSFYPLVRRNVLRDLNQLGSIRMLTLKIRASYADTVSEASRDLGSAFKAAIRAAEADTVELTLKPEANARTWLGGKAKAVITSLAGRADIREGADRFVVRGLNTESELLETIDVLRDELVVEKDIAPLTDRSRALNAQSAFAAVEEAHTDLGTELERAPHIE